MIETVTARGLSQLLANEQSARRVPSVAAAIVRGGSVVWSDAVGTVDARADGAAATTDTQYRIGSITKTFVAVEIMRLRDEGRLDLGDTIGAHLPEVPFGHVTIAQLMSHTSGLQAETDGQWWERAPGESWDALVASVPVLRLTPGTRFHYSNVGFATLGELVSRLRGMPWRESVRTSLLEPLGMLRTTARPSGLSAPGLAVHPFADLVHVEPEHDAGAMAPAGQLWSTADDLATWAAFLGGKTSGLLSPATLTEMLKPVALSDVPGNAWGGAHALGWQMWNVAGTRFAGHGGSMPGFVAGLRVNVATGDGAVVMANATSGLGPLDAALLDQFVKAEPPSPTPWSVDTTQADDLDLVGDWFWGTYRFTLATGRDGSLSLGQPGQGRGAVFRRQGEGWTGDGGYYSREPLVAERDADGVPSRLVLASFVFTRTPYESGADVPGGLHEAGWH